MKLFLKQNVFYILLLAFILFVPFSNGLFNEGVFLSSLILLLILVGVFTLKSKKIFIDKYLFMLFFFQFLIVLVSTILGVNREGSIYGFYKILFAPLIFFLILNLNNLRTEKKLSEDQIESVLSSFDILVIMFFISGSAISVINMLLKSVGYFSTTDNIRTDGVIGYANTLALFLFICSIAGMYLYYNFNFHIRIKVIIMSGICANMIVLILTFSRTMWILAIPLYMFFLIMQRKSGSLFDFAFLVCVAILSGGVISNFNSVLRCLFFVLIPLTIIFYEYILKTKFSSFFIKKMNKKRKVISVKVIAFMVVCIVIASVGLITSTTLLNRITSVSLNASELQERFAYYRDALRIIKDYPFFGTGAGGWSSLQFHYQTALYSVGYVHSSIFQIALDYGLPGLLIYFLQVLVFVMYLVSALKRKLKSKVRNLIICAAVCNIAIILHSLIDFDMEFPLIILVFWTNIALLASISTNKRVITQKNRTIKIVVLIILAFLVITLMPINLSSIFYTEGVSKYNINDLNKSQKYLKMAISINPYSSSAYYVYGKSLVSMSKSKSDNSLLMKCLNYLEKAEKYDTKNPKYAETKIEEYNISHDYYNCTIEYKKLISMAPMKMEYYEGLSESLLTLGEADDKAGRSKRANIEFIEVTKIKNTLEEAEKQVSRRANKLKHKLDLKITPELAYNIGRAYIYLGNNKKAIEFFKIASEGKIIPKQWLLK